MSRSINNRDTDWRREWEEEQDLTPEERKKADADAREEARIQADLEAMVAEVKQIREEEERAERILELDRRRWRQRTMRHLKED